MSLKVHTRDVLWAVNDDLGTIDNVNDNAGLTAVRSVGDQAETTSLNETLKHLKVPTTKLKRSMGDFWVTNRGESSHLFP